METNRWKHEWTVREAVELLGVDFLRGMFAHHPQNTAGYCESRAAGWWDANDPDRHGAWTALGRAIRAGISPLESIGIQIKAP